MVGLQYSNRRDYDCKTAFRSQQLGTSALSVFANEPFVNEGSIEAVGTAKISHHRPTGNAIISEHWTNHFVLFEYV